ncbi:carboxymuconolactone decarboxylase family protein [Chitinophaga filiformis]|uniref:Carboxymuconolactone decarboxylase family protein n=1 Tax=Chitinophaga filiformis TaxID=104663 RepID=A0ABY4I1V9_CHIFI|nr:carboxymuconolactone decarboxylase family protein [Chitinophaga filiformis]UPK69835.1 carboxymuconolactone decarboxylase family protein [Chitinophaga filiformis]
MKAFKVPNREEVSPANQAIFDTLKKKLGKVPNSYAFMASSENGLANYLALSNAKSSLTIREKEVINLIVSAINDCHYCVSAHTVIGKLNGFTDEQILEIRRGNISFDAKLNALVQFVKEVTNKKGNASQQAIDNFFAAGYTNESLVDTLMIISERTFSNYLNAIVKVPIDFPVAPEI